MHSRSRVRKNLDAKRKGRHQGAGKRRGTKEARSNAPTQLADFNLSGGCFPIFFLAFFNFFNKFYMIFNRFQLNLMIDN